MWIDCIPVRPTTDIMDTADQALDPLLVFYQKRSYMKGWGHGNTCFKI